jgi:hypothetical protein
LWKNAIVSKANVLLIPWRSDPDNSKNKAWWSTMRFFLLAAMTVLPGSWLTFGISLDELNWRTRLALGIALSPIVLAVQLYLLRTLHFDFSHAVFIIFFVNLPCIVFITRKLPKDTFPGLSTPFWVASVILSYFLGLMLMLWLFIPNFRTFSWHALSHTDIVYLIARNPFLPEEPGMAHTALAAPWMDHVYWSVTGWLTDWPPTVLYPLTNIVWLIITFSLAYELAYHGLGLHSSTALQSSALTFVGTNIVGAIGYLATDNRRLFGDVRYTPLLGKYFAFETIPFAFALIIGLALICVLILQRNTRSLLLLVPILHIALGLMYPILFPIGCILVIFTILLSSKIIGSSSLDAGSTPLLLVIGLLISTTIFLSYLAIGTSESSVPTLQINVFSKFKTHTKNSLLALLPSIIIGLPFIIRGIIVRHRPTILLTASGLISIGLYLLFELRGLEYKFILAATLLLMPITAGGVEHLFVQQLRSRWIVSLVTPLAFVLIFAFLIFKTEVHIPDNLRNAPNVIEDSFWIHLNINEDDSGWTRAVHYGTPEDTILVFHSSGIHLGPFANRTLFLPGIGDSDARTGYSNYDYYLFWQRGYPKASFDNRSNAIETLYSETNREKLSEVINTLLTFGRPLAIHFSGDDTPALVWLKQINIGSELYSDSKNLVWFIDRMSNGLLNQNCQKRSCQ